MGGVGSGGMAVGLCLTRGMKTGQLSWRMPSILIPARPRATLSLAHTVSRQADQRRQPGGHSGMPRTKYGIVWRGGSPTGPTSVQEAPWEKGARKRVAASVIIDVRTDGSTQGSA